ncbi:aromatic acid exporter family protein [Heyndrickxia acidicola]|uniref:Aromatic acid exporter family protein n=1 Tax=Heyndrickxia acidicola TaxID=209389 RepID=A0ABU6MKM1_9BACI|nr:aromatic acid exporter family protein [Heyndrickxia acidicola]MED1205234.1 aromatic acid exporter family protein [Heyndrickxia acidicola]
MFRIGYRTLKTSLGTPIAIFISELFHLQNFLSAGILTILCIQNTKKKSIHAAWTRFVACITAMIFSTVFFEILGYNPIAIGIELLLFIPTTVLLKAKEGVVSSSVIILHFFAKGSISLHFIINEISIVVIGLSVALIVNLYMPSIEAKLKQYQEKIEDDFRKIFEEIICYLRTNSMSWDGREITETGDLLEKGIQLAFRDVENHLMTNESYYYTYFKMRQQQFEIIERNLRLITSISHMVEQRQMVADFIEELKENIKPRNTALKRLEKLEQLQESIQDMELPKTREEFEARAALFQFLREMEDYLIIKSTFKEKQKRNEIRLGKAN